MYKSINVIEKNYFDDVLIVFSSRHMPKGNFTLYQQLIRVNFPANLIFINDYSNQYYINGTPEFCNSIEFIQYILGQIHRLKRKYGKLFIFGASMGAYAALKYGSILQADKILTFGVEYKLGLPLSHSYETLFETSDTSFSDLSKLVYKEPRNICIISGMDDISDLYSASILQDTHPNFNIHMINNYGHAVSKYINSRVSLPTFLWKYFMEHDFNIQYTLATGKPLDLSLVIDIQRFYHSNYEENILLNIKSTIKKISEKYPAWSKIQFFRAKLFFLDNNIEKSKKYLEISINNISDDLERTRLKLALVYFKNNKINMGINESEILKNKNFSLEITNLLIRLYQGKRIV